MRDPATVHIHILIHIHMLTQIHIHKIKYALNNAHYSYKYTCTYASHIHTCTCNVDLRNDEAEWVGVITRWGAIRGSTRQAAVC